MGLSYLSDLATILGVTITFFGILIFYFGRIILKSRKETTKDITSDILLGFLFLIDCIIVPIIIVYVIFLLLRNYILPFLLYGQGIDWLNLLYIIVGGLLIFIQYGISEYYHKKLKKTEGTKRLENYIVSIFVILITGLFIIKRDWFYLSVSLIFSFIIYTYMASRDPFRNKKDVKDGRWLEIFLTDKEIPFKAKIKRWGDEFIDIINEKREEISINKSEIFSIQILKKEKPKSSTSH